MYFGYIAMSGLVVVACCFILKARMAKRATTAQLNDTQQGDASATV
jgi:hypothetical protein